MRLRAVVASLLTALSLAGPASAAGPDDAARQLGVTRLAGAPAPSFRLSTVDDRPLALADLRGRGVVLYFWATW